MRMDRKNQKVKSILIQGKNWDYGHFGIEGKGGINLKDKTPFYEGKIKYGRLGQPNWKYGYGAYGKYGSDSGGSVGAYATCMV